MKLINLIRVSEEFNLGFCKTLVTFLLILFSAGFVFAQSQEVPAQRDENLKYMDQGIKQFEAGEYEGADKSFRIVLESVKVLPAEICYYFGMNSYYLKRYKQSINWLNKYIELKGTSGQYFEECSKILKMAEQEYLEANKNQEPPKNIAEEQAKNLSGLSEIDCDSGVRIICPVCMGKTVIIKKGLFGNEYQTCPYCDDHGTLSCEEYNLLLRGELKPRSERETADNDQQ